MELNQNKNEIKVILQEISDVLLMNGGFLSNPGLYTGEMGLVLFFSKYARYTKNNLYLEYAYNLMEIIQNKIHRDTPINYQQGLTGIGSAIEYLVQNGFFEADTDEVLNDFDKQIFYKYNLSNLLIEETMDIGHYASWRLLGNSSQKDLIRRTILPQLKLVLLDCPVDLPWLQMEKNTLLVSCQCYNVVNITYLCRNFKNLCHGKIYSNLISRRTPGIASHISTAIQRKKIFFDSQPVISFGKKYFSGYLQT